MEEPEMGTSAATDREHEETERDDEPAEYGVSNQEIVTRSRLDAILEWHNKVIQREDEIQLWVAQGRIPPEKGDALYKASVSAFVQQLQTVIAQREDGEKWLNQYNLGRIVVEPPNPYKEAWEEENGGRIGGKVPDNPTDLPRNWEFAEGEDPDPVARDVNGLLGFTRLPPEIEATWTISYDRVYHTQPYTIKVSKKQPVGREISKRAFEIASHLAEDMGLDVDITDISPSFDL